MINLLRINAQNFEDILYEIKSIEKSDLLSTLKDCFLYAPHKSEYICRLIISLPPEDQELVKDLIKQVFANAESIESKISVLIYAKGLNYRIPQIKVKVIENDLEITNLDNELEFINLDNELEINEYLNNLEIFLEKNNFSGLNEIGLFKIICIIKNYQFDIYECLDELKKECDFKLEYIGILYLANDEKSSTNSFYLINLLLRSLQDKEGVDLLLKILPIMNKPFRDMLIPFIHEYFINRRTFKNSQEIKFLFDSPEELSEIKKFIDEETVVEMKKFMSIQSLELFVPEFRSIYETELITPISREDFNLDKLNSDKKGFYRDFCLLGSPSITHFLSYLEIHKEEMRMNEEEEKLFMEVFDEIFGNRTSFKRIVIGKMKKFNFLRGDYVQ